MTRPNPSTRLSTTSRAFLLFGSIGVLLTSPSPAATYDWASPTDGGLWSSAANWSPAGGPPTGGDIVNLIDATADRTIIHDTNAPRQIGTINFNQTSAFTNTLEVQLARGQIFTVDSPITLGANNGIEELRIISLLGPDETGHTVDMRAPGGITLNNGGRLTLGLGGSNVATTRFTGNVFINGGELVVTDSLAPKDAAQRYLTGALTANGGSIAIGASQTQGTREARLAISGDFNVTGTAISGSGDAQLILDGATNTIGAGTTFTNPGTGSRTITTVLSRSGNQTLTSEVALGKLFFRQFQNGTFIKTVTVADQSGPNVDQLQFAGRGGQTIGLKLGSNLRTGPSASQPIMSGVTQSGDINFSIDTNGYTLALGNTTASWAPTLAGGASVTSVTWSLINSGAAGGGGISARGFEFNRPNVVVNIGEGMVLEAWSGNNVANNLGAGSIHDTSTFRYTGAAEAATPSTLVSARPVGNLEIGNGSTAGSLKLAGDITADGHVTVRNLGSFDLGTQTLEAFNSGVTVQAGGILRGGNATTAGAIMGDVIASGTLAPGTTPSATGETIGTLSVLGSLTMEEGSTLALEIVSASSFDKLVAGSVFLDGTVNLNLSLGESYVHIPDTAFVLLDNVGGGEIDGFFTWGGPEGVLSEGETFFVNGNPFEITYFGGLDANDVVITAMVPEPSAFAALVGGAGMILGLRRNRRCR